MQDILLIGASGMLGRDILEALGSVYRVTAPSRSQLDITDRDQVFDHLMEIQPEVVINCAAYSDVDACERDVSTARSINALGPKFLSQAASHLKAHYMQVSSDYVFDGSKPPRQPYHEEDPPAPVNVYGSTKLEGEVFVRSITPDHLIVRTAWLYNRHGRSFLRSILQQAMRGRKLRVVNDQFGAPTWCRTLSIQIRALLEEHVTGTVHATSHGHCTWYDFAKEFLQTMGIKSELKACNSSDFPRPATRPVNCILGHRRLQMLGLDRMSHWKKDLRRFVEAHGQGFCSEIFLS